MMGKFNFEDYRQPWETGPHWELKKEFIEKYEDMFEEDRLLCLAQAYANVILMNCNYPDPVMRQISELSKPLQLRKKFQGISSNTESAPSKNEKSKVSGKRKSIYDQAGKSFKEVKFCASDEQFKSTLPPGSTNSHLPPLEQSKNSNFSFVPGQQRTQSFSQTSTVLSLNTTKEPKTVCQKEDNILENEKYERIISVLGLPLIQNFAEMVETVKLEPENEVQALLNIAKKLGIKDISFKFDIDPDSPEHARLHISKFYINDCEIASKTGFKKREAKMLCAKAALNTFSKLGMSHKNSSGVKSQMNSNSASQLKSSIPKNMDCMELLEVFNKRIVSKNRFNNVPAISILKSIASSIDMDDYIRFDINSYKISSVETEFCCTFYLKDILISNAKDNIADDAKNNAAELGLQKLSNLSDFEIQNGKLELKHANSIDQTSDSEISCSNSQTYQVEKPHFILNRALYDFSLRDGFVVVEREKYKSDIKQYSKTILSESASFNHKAYDCQFEDVDDGICRSKKAVLFIDGKLVSFGVAPIKEEAKAAACLRALSNLKKKYYTLKIKDEYVEGFIVTRNQVFDGESFSSNVISESNIGCKMLKSMGWTGGGLGVTGIVEPIQATAKLSLGTGLGFEASQEPKNSQLFKKRLEALLREFCRTENYSDLVFSKDFTKEERKIIHLLANRMHLHTQSRGVGNERFLTVRQKYETLKLLKFLANSGGSNSKFELIDDSGISLEI